MNNSAFLENLQTISWNIPPVILNETNWNELADGRVAYTNDEFKSFIGSFKTCSNNQDNIWFLSADDYRQETDNEFAWNEFENQSREYAVEEELYRIDLFWKSHLPFLMSVKNGYTYVAVGISELNKGKIFLGTEPEYEEVTLIADTFEEFKAAYIEALKGNYTSAFYSFIV